MCSGVQVSTVAGWSHIFYRTWDSTIVLSLVYYIGIIMFVSYILMNLFLAGVYLFSSALYCLERTCILESTWITRKYLDR